MYKQLNEYTGTIPVITYDTGGLLSMSERLIFVGFILGNRIGTHSRAILRFFVFYNDSASPNSQ